MFSHSTHEKNNANSVLRCVSHSSSVDSINNINYVEKRKERLDDHMNTQTVLAFTDMV